MSTIRRNQVSSSTVGMIQNNTIRGAVNAARLALFLLAVMSVTSAGTAWAGSADDDNTNTPTGGADSRAVRLASVEGDVQVIQDGQVIANPALANLPMFEGTQVVTGNEGRAEVQLDDGGSIARLSPNTTLTFTVLQQQGSRIRTEVVVNGGLAYFEMKPSNSERSLKVNYGTTAFSATSFSVVRVSMDSAPGRLAVFFGECSCRGGGRLSGGRSRG